MDNSASHRCVGTSHVLDPEACPNQLVAATVEIAPKAPSGLPFIGSRAGHVLKVFRSFKKRLEMTRVTETCDD